MYVQSQNDFERSIRALVFQHVVSFRANAVLQCASCHTSKTIDKAHHIRVKCCMVLCEIAKLGRGQVEPVSGVQHLSHELGHSLVEGLALAVEYGDGVDDTIGGLECQ